MKKNKIGVILLCSYKTQYKVAAALAPDEPRKCQVIFEILCHGGSHPAEDQDVRPFDGKRIIFNTQS